ncbi:MAG: HNH endonuclease [Gammaproteobacteria bacterium]|nr:HNH endonuclease [Gammaproteobacteria bacterium]
MPSKLIRLRTSAFNFQSGRCFYCGYPMWETDCTAYAQKYKMSPSQAKALQCTAEHLDARKDGGKDNPKNIVAACRWCNQKRHQRKLAPSPNDFRKLVQKRLRKGGWICESIAVHF